MNANPFQMLQKFYLDQPEEVSLETLTHCNAACTFCPYPTLERKGIRMSTSLIYRLIDEMSEWRRPFFFSPFKVNEPLLDHRLFNICTRLTNANKNAALRLFTNGSALTQSKISDIALLENVAHLWVSLNSHEPQEYRRIMRLDFAHTTRNLDRLHQAMEIGEFQHPVVISRVSPYIKTDNAQKPCTMDSVDGEFYNYCLNRWPMFVCQLIKQDGWLGYVPPASPDIPDTPCVRWFELSILSTGVASLCCMDGKGDFPIGTVHHNTLLEIYNHPTWRERREKLLSRLNIHPCRTCTY